MAAERGKQVVPTYKHTASLLRAYILGMDGQPPIQLPREVELAQSYGVARGTIRHALDILETEGLIRRTRHIGTTTIPDGITRRRRTHGATTIAVITTWYSWSTMPGAYYGRAFQGINRQAAEQGYAVVTTHMGGAFPDIGPAYQPEDPSRVIGAIFLGVFDERVIEMHVDAGYPVVCVDYWPTNPQADAVVSDCFVEGQIAVEFLLRQGHSRLFYLGNLQNVGDRNVTERDAQLMLAGCRQMFEEMNIAQRDMPTHFCRPTTESIDLAVDWICSLDPAPTAGIVFNHDTSAVLRERLRTRGIQCPEDLSLLSKGYLGLDSDAAMIVTDPDEIGSQAVRSLIDRISGQRTVAHRIAIPSQLKRGSTVALPKST